MLEILRRQPQQSLQRDLQLLPLGLDIHGAQLTVQGSYAEIVVRRSGEITACIRAFRAREHLLGIRRGGISLYKLLIQYAEVGMDQVRLAGGFIQALLILSP